MKTRVSGRLGKNHLPDVDMAGQKARLAVREVVFPQPPEPLVESERRQVRPGRAKAVAPCRQRAGIVVAKYFLCNQREAETVPEIPENAGRGEHAPGEDVAADEIDFAP